MKRIIIVVLALMKNSPAALLISYVPQSGVHVVGRSFDSTSATNRTWGFSETIPLVDAREKSGVNARIYGGVHMVTGGPTSSFTVREHQDGFFNAGATSEDPIRTIKAVLLWNKEDFLSGGADRKVVFDANSSVSLRTDAFPQDSLAVRLVVKQDDLFYISKNTSDGGDYTWTHLPSETWAPFNPIDYSWQDEFVKRTFTNIQGVGVFASAINHSVDRSTVRFNVRHFIFSADKMATQGGFFFGLKPTTQPLPFRLRGYERRPWFGDVDQYVDRAYQHLCNVVTIGPMNGHHWTAFPTQHGFPRPSLQPDFIPAKIAALHRRGIAGIGWVPFSVQNLDRVEDYQPALRYPQWKMEFIDWPDLPQPGMQRVAMCVVSTPWRQIHSEVLREVADLGVDGIFFDGFFLGGQPNPVAPGCVCSSCQDLFREETGLDTPKQVDWSDMTFRRWVRWRNIKLVQTADYFTERIRRNRPDLPVTFNWNTWPHGTKDWETAVPLWAQSGLGVSQHAQTRRDDFEWVTLGYKARLSHALNPGHSDIWRRGHPLWTNYEGTDEDLLRHELTMRTFMLAGLSYGTTPWVGGGIEPMDTGIRVHEAVREREHFFSQDALRHIGVVVSQNTHDFYGHLPETANLIDYRDTILGTWLLLTEQQAPFTLVFDNQLDAGYLAGFDLLLLPDTACLSEEMVAQIGQYVENGGRVVATGNAGAYDEWARPLQENPLAVRAGITLLQGEPGREWLRHRNQDAVARLLDALNPAEWPLRVDGPPWLVANAFWAPGQEGKTLWVHLLNVSMFYPGGDTGFRGVSSDPVYEEIFSRIHEPIGEIAVSVPGWSIASARMGVSGTDLAVSGDGSMMIPELDIHDVLILELEE